MSIEINPADETALAGCTMRSRREPGAMPDSASRAFRPGSAGIREFVNVKPVYPA